MQIINMDTGARIRANNAFIKTTGYTEKETMQGDIYHHSRWVDEEQQRVITMDENAKLAAQARIQDLDVRYTFLFKSIFLSFKI